MKKSIQFAVARLVVLALASLLMAANDSVFADIELPHDIPPSLRQLAPP